MWVLSFLVYCYVFFIFVLVYIIYMCSSKNMHCYTYWSSFFFVHVQTFFWKFWTFQMKNLSIIYSHQKVYEPNHPKFLVNDISGVLKDMHCYTYWSLFFSKVKVKKFISEMHMGKYFTLKVQIKNTQK